MVLRPVTLYLTVMYLRSDIYFTAIIILREHCIFTVSDWTSTCRSVVLVVIWRWNFFFSVDGLIPAKKKFYDQPVHEMLQEPHSRKFVKAIKFRHGFIRKKKKENLSNFFNHQNAGAISKLNRCVIGVRENLKVGVQLKKERKEKKKKKWKKWHALNGSKKNYFIFTWTPCNQFKWDSVVISRKDLLQTFIFFFFSFSVLEIRRKVLIKHSSLWFCSRYHAVLKDKFFFSFLFSIRIWNRLQMKWRF